MVTIRDPKLTLTTVDDNVTIRVQYIVVVSDFELASFPPEVLPITALAWMQNPERDKSITVPRAQLQEDTDVGDEDEIRL